MSAVDKETDWIGLIDLIELELDLSTGRKSVRSRLLQMASELQDGKTVETAEYIVILLDVVHRLGKVEEYLCSFGFETARDTSQDNTS